MPWSTDDLKRLVEVEAQLQKVDPKLAMAVVSQESEWNPNAVGDNGNSIGLFQLQPGAAKDAGLHPRFRSNPADNITAGITYLKQKLTQSGGNVEQALSRYNRGTPDYRGIGDPNYVQNVLKHYPDYQAQAQPPPRQQPGILNRAAAMLSPASAEASTPPSAGSSRLQELEAELARRDQQAAPGPPPQATGDTQPPPPVSQTAPTAQTPPEASQTPSGAWTPGMRFQALPSIAQLEPGERMQKTKLFESLDPKSQEEFLQSEQPVAAGLAAGGGPAQRPQPVTDPTALLAVGGGPQAAPTAPTRGPASALDPYTPEQLSTDLVNRPHEAGIPLSAVPAIAVNTLGTVGGAALGAPLGPVGSAAGAALGGSLATRANVAMGLAEQEKPLLETPFANVYPSDLLGAIPLGITTGSAALKGTVRNLPGANVGKHELAAERLGELGQRTAPSRPAGELFSEAATQGGAVPTVNLWRAAGKIVREEKGMEKGFVSTDAMQAGSGLLSLMKKHGGTVPLEELEKYRQRLGQKIGTTTDQAELRRLREMYAALHSDLEQAATTGTAAGAGTLREAIATSRKEHAHTTLTDLWSEGKGLQKTSGDVTQVYGKRIRNQFEKRLSDDKLFAGSFTKDELTDIRSTLRDVSKLTKVTNPEAQGAVGSTLKWLGRLGGAGGAGYGVATGDLSTMLTGGSMLLATEGATAVLANAMQSKVGRWALREAIREGNGKMTHGSLAAIAALVAREAAPDAPAPEQKP